MLVHVMYEEKQMFCYTGLSKADTISKTCEVLCDKVAGIRHDWKDVTVGDLRIQHVTLPFKLNSDFYSAFPIWCMFLMHCTVHKIPFCAISSAKKDLDDLKYALIWSIMNGKSMSVEQLDEMCVFDGNVDINPAEQEMPMHETGEEAIRTPKKKRVPYQNHINTNCYRLYSLEDALIVARAEAWHREITDEESAEVEALWNKKDVDEDHVLFKIGNIPFRVSTIQRMKPCK